jgi:hypothetical protein
VRLKTSNHKETACYEMLAGSCERGLAERLLVSEGLCSIELVGSLETDTARVNKGIGKKR